MYSAQYTRVDEQQLMERVQTMISRGEVRTVNDALKMQLLDVRLEDGYKPSKVEHWHPYGFSHHPKSRAEVLALALGGNRDHMVIIGTADRRYRVREMAAGEVAVHDDQGQVVHFKRDRILVKSSKPVTIEAPTIELKGEVRVTGDIIQTGSITSTGVHDASAHV